METIGSRLRKAREKKGLSLEEAQKALKIHPKILMALEDNRASEFLSTVYIRSFLKTYARYLELDASKIVEEFASTHSEEPQEILYPGTKKSSIASKLDIEKLKKYTPLAIKVTAGALVLVMALFVVTGMVRFVKSRVAGLFERGEVVQSAALPALDKEEDTSINIPLSKPLNLLIESKEDVWVEVKSDGEVVFRNVISGGSAEVWNADKEIELWVGNSSALDLTLNDIPLGPIGRGVKKGILITRKGIKLP